MKTPSFPLAAVSALALVASVFAQNRTFTNQYSFGDSLSDSGNLFAATRLLGAPNPPPPYFQGRFSNGPVFTELLGNNLALAAATPVAVRSSLNFAFGGSMAGGTNALPPSLTLQIGLFQQRGITPQRTDLFTVLAGANDLIPVLTAASTPTNPAALDAAGFAAAQSVATGVQSLIGLGAKNLVVLGLPNLGLTPRTLAAGGPGGTGSLFGTRATVAFNGQLRTRLQGIASAAADVNLVYVDLQGVIDRLAQDYRALGFANATSYYLAPAAQGGGQGDPNSYIFWDDIHPTARTHALLADIVTETLNPEIPLGFAATQGSAALALRGLATGAAAARASQLAFSKRPTGRMDAYAGFTYGDGNRAREGGRGKFKHTGQVVTAGADWLASDGFLLGGALDVGRLNATVSARQGDYTIEDVAGRLYGAWRGGPVSLLIDASYGSLTLKGIHRATAFGGLRTSGKSGGDHWGAGLKAAWAVDLGGSNFLQPWFGLRTERVTLDPYAEKDVPALAFAFDEQEAESTSAAVGVDFSTTLVCAGRSARFDLRAAWHGEVGSDDRSVTGRLADNFTRPTVLAVKDGDGRGLELGAGLTTALTKTWSGSISYTADIRQRDRVAHRGVLSVQTGF
ncbi:MAG: autotransporter domain-containing protein [Opitutaceae bacterium]|nr:autotransporter domain-containing protein [Opitutaceae bacterium]